VATTMMVIGMVITAAGGLFLVGSLVRSIQQERRRSRVHKIWKNFGLSIAFCVLFLTTWVAQALTEGQVYRSEQLAAASRPTLRASRSSSSNPRWRTGSRSSSSCSRSWSSPRC
jgi:hypothetical protein